MLVDCINDYISEEESKSPASQNIGYLQYLNDAPKLTNPEDVTNAKQCGNLKEYLGYDRDLLDNEYICENVYQLRYTDDFDFLNEFFDQGSGGNGPGLCGGGADFDASCVLTEPLLAADFPSVILKGKKWRSTNFALAQIADGLGDILSLNGDLECPSGPGVNQICVGFKNVTILILYIIYIIFRLTADISDQCYNEYAELGNIEPKEIYENTNVIYENMIASLDTTITAITDESEKIIDTLTPPVQTWVTATETPVKFAGCDGVDSNYDNVVDECIEDTYPPSIVIPQGGGIVGNIGTSNVASVGQNGFYFYYFVPCDGADRTLTTYRQFNPNPELSIIGNNIWGIGTLNNIVLQEEAEQYCLVIDTATTSSSSTTVTKKNTSFKTIDDAKRFLEMSLQLEDDCGRSQDLYYEFDNVMDGMCQNTKFSVTPVHSIAPDDGVTKDVYYCEDGYELRGPTVDFILGVDGIPPSIIDIGFNPPSTTAPTTFELSDDGKTIFIEEYDSTDPNTFVDVGFYFDVEDDCPGTVDVSMEITTNEFVQGIDTMRVALNKDVSATEGEDLVDEVNLFVLPKSCAGSTLSGEGIVCTVDPCATFKYYTINFEVTDASGNSVSDTLWIVIRPRGRDITVQDASCGTRRQLRQRRQERRELKQAQQEKQQQQELINKKKHQDQPSGVPQKEDETIRLTTSSVPSSNSSTSSSTSSTSNIRGGANKNSSVLLRSKQLQEEKEGDIGVDEEDEDIERDLGKKKKKSNKTPTKTPSSEPTVTPSTNPSTSPSLLPTTSPSVGPTIAPTTSPSAIPTTSPSIQPTVSDESIAEYINTSTSNYSALGGGTINFSTPV